ncbi:MAG: universal stress protein [Acidobacteria bacterium]|nr:universal stress protein [Acidobacteriota bacterium]
MFEDIVIGWDGGPSASAAVDWAVRRSLGERIVLLAVIDDRVPEADDGSPLESATAARTSVEAAVARLREPHPGARIRSEVVVGDTTQVLEHRTGRTRLVVIGTDPRSRAGRWSHTTASRIASRAHGPVAVVPLGSAVASGPVVAGVDGTAASIAAARWAAELARSSGTALVIAHAWQAAGEPDDPADDGTALEPARLGVDADLVGEDEPSRTLPEAHAAVLKQVVDEVRAAYPDVPVEPRLLHGAAPLMLQRAAADAALLVLGRHSRWSASAVLLGSVTHSLLLSSTVPVLVVGAHEAPDEAAPAALRESALDVAAHHG